MGFSSSLSIVVLEVVARLSEDLLEHAADVAYDTDSCLPSKGQALHRFFAPSTSFARWALMDPALWSDAKVVVHPLQLSPLVRVPSPKTAAAATPA